jgi:outer membrane protein TolC
VRTYYCMVRQLWIAAAFAAAAAGGARAQQLELTDALQRASTHAYANRIADADADAQAGEGMRVWQGILPTARIEAGFMRTTDPIGAFGTTLRQRSITQADFDPARLNYPAVAPNYSAALILEQPLLNADVHVARRAAREAVRARALAAEWTRSSTAVEVVRAYYGAVLSAERVSTLSAAHAAALGHVRQAELMVKEGVVTRSDVLQARVHAGDVAAQLAEAQGDARMAKRQLATVLGAPGDTLFTLPASLPTAHAIRSVAAIDWGSAAAGRSDVRAAAAGAAAARADLLRARAAWLPRLNAMARYDWNSPDSPFGGDENWSLGIMASWTLSAGSEVADVRAAGGRHSAARAQSEAAVAAAHLAVAADANTWETALERMAIAEDAVDQSVEAHRLVARRYEGGLAAAVELLSVSAMEAASRLRLAHAKYEALAAAANRLLGLGRDPAELARQLGNAVESSGEGTER